MWRRSDGQSSYHVDEAAQLKCSQRRWFPIPILDTSPSRDKPISQCTKEYVLIISSVQQYSVSLTFSPPYSAFIHVPCKYRSTSFTRTTGLRLHHQSSICLKISPTITDLSDLSIPQARMCTFKYRAHPCGHALCHHVRPSSSFCTPHGVCPHVSPNNMGEGQWYLLYDSLVKRVYGICQKRQVATAQRLYLITSTTLWACWIRH